MEKRVFLIVLDSVGIGEMSDSAEYGDAAMESGSWDIEESLFGK